jgi:hypothetical protein
VRFSKRRPYRDFAIHGRVIVSFGIKTAKELGVIIEDLGYETLRAEIGASLLARKV